VRPKAQIHFPFEQNPAFEQLSGHYLEMAQKSAKLVGQIICPE
jgi:hypothetical protein